jgi:hypothetical protein
VLHEQIAGGRAGQLVGERAFGSVGAQRDEFPERGGGLLV